MRETVGLWHPYRSSRTARKTIQFVAPNGKRKSIRLGKVAIRAAEAVKLKVEHLVSALTTKHALDAETSLWLAGISDDLREKLTRAGLISQRESATVGEFLTEYISGRTDVKPATKTVWRQVKRNLVDFLGPDRILRSVTAAQAEEFRMFLLSEKLRDTTIHKRLTFARQFFSVMKRQGLIEKNPFVDVKHSAGDASERQHFVTREDTAKLLEGAPDATWRTIISLCRYGGLRCPSEVLSLKWDGVDWAKNRFRVDSPKTEHHAGKGFRIVPIFPELKLYLEEAWDTAEEGAVYVIGGNYRRAAQGKNGWVNCNVRTQFSRIVARAGLTAWPRLFHNLRASRETELVADFPEHIAAEWIGNSVQVARRHYLQVTEEAFKKAVQNPVQSAPVRNNQGPPKKRQNPVFPEKDEDCGIMNTCQVERKRFELSTSALRTNSKPSSSTPVNHLEPKDFRHSTGSNGYCNCSHVLAIRCRKRGYSSPKRVQKGMPQKSEPSTSEPMTSAL